MDIRQALDDCGISRRRAGIIVKCVEVSSVDLNVVDIGDTPIPAPRIVGPAFDDDHDLAEGGDGMNDEEVIILQRYLTKFGSYTTSLDGDFGPNTKKAVLSFQHSAGGELKEDGIVGPNTKGVLLKSRCFNPDTPSKKDDDEKSSSGYKGKKTLKYWLGASPGKLKRKKVEQEISDAFKVWSPVTGIRFKQIDDQKTADLKLQWSLEWMNSDALDLFPFDGAGHTLAKGVPDDGVFFDRAETWLLQGTKAKAKQFYLLPVAIHEIGHVLGLDHSSSFKDLMVTPPLPSCYNYFF